MTRRGARRKEGRSQGRRRGTMKEGQEKGGGVLGEKKNRREKGNVKKEETSKGKKKRRRKRRKEKRRKKKKEKERRKEKKKKKEGRKTSKIQSSGVPAAVRERRQPGNQTAPEAGTALQPRPPSERHTDPGRRGPTGAARAAPGGATPSGAPERGAQRATTHTVGSTENGRLRDRRAPWFSGPDTESPNAGALTRAVRPQKVGGIEGRALEIRAL
ncbi:hypothetical protein NDU88_005798 [Pleurodeles waltl]|uniref:Uncharacterized protein n=1 Tax=Pleurodeles waltl TaxID=8319 RepID=A0AAV7LT35_PLEWA|nr:hypothetical protein NDU88_005798 [Pleurodeles waltl]